jgi:hypothetical protein
MRYGRDYDRNFISRAAHRARGWMSDRAYDRGYRGGAHPGPPQDTNWMGRNYREPGYEPRRGYGADSARGYGTDFGRGYRPGHGGWEVEWERGGPPREEMRGHDRGWQRGRERGYDRGWRGGEGMGGGFGAPYMDPVAREAQMGIGPQQGTGPNWTPYGQRGLGYWRGVPRGDRWFTAY